MKHLYLILSLFSMSVFANISHPNFALADYYSSDLFYQKLNVSKAMYDEVKPLYNQLQQSKAHRSFDDMLSISYMESPIYQSVISLAAIRHLSASLLADSNVTPESLEHSILALFYLERLALVSADSTWAVGSQRKLGRLVNQVLSYSSLNVDESLQSHTQFHHAFNKASELAIPAGNALVASLIQDPGNVMTLTLITGSRLWLGGEAGFDDPSTLNYFILTSFYSVRAIAMAHALENKVIANPQNHRTMRLASILGGWTTLPRRWLAGIHQDKLSQILIEQEHAQWFQVNPGFHSVTLASSYFNEPQYFFSGYNYLMQGLTSCNQDLSFRSCSDNPRFSFNRLVFITTIIDYSIKAGDFNTANALLGVKNWPEFHWSEWQLGQSAWQLRENNMAQLHESWNNDSVDDDIPLITTTKRQWGDDTMTCQTCHQQQGRAWTKEQEEQAKNPSPSISVIGQWPPVTTSWTSSEQAFIDCSQSAFWDNQAVYQVSQQVQFKHALYEAKWWTKSEQPNSSNEFDVWQFIGFCHEGSVR
ncbi:hypothetical protein [Pseudoalteromonas sp. S16_S37]|uniref:hypothetical protein n=1 Tax=Pseudoalteromonas sp. S16_S37 TaxID=2720228 RepID=UPI001681AD11|nr:hypothetical protein [Pseudoalteromonas sp. S16_S37]MBD1582913.1 hypothetical protein [Pseudoalteromonas sp. S16_S37]